MVKICPKYTKKVHYQEMLFSLKGMSNSSATPWSIAHPAPLCMGFARQEHWSELPFPSPGLPNPGSSQCLLHWKMDYLLLSHLSYNLRYYKTMEQHNQSWLYLLEGNVVNIQHLIIGYFFYQNKNLHLSIKACTLFKWENLDSVTKVRNKEGYHIGIVEHSSRY